MDEPLDPLVAIVVQRATRNDEQPAGVPDRPANQPGVGDRLRGIEDAAVMIGAEPRKLPDTAVFVREGIVLRDPQRIVQGRDAQREGDWELLIEDLPFADLAAVPGGRAQDIVPTGTR